MLNRNQLITLLMLHRRKDNLISALPKRLIVQHLSIIAYDPNSDIAKLLHAIAHDANPKIVEEMLKKNPRLLLEASDVKDAAGNIIKRVTPYECALGAGDDDMAGIIGNYFAEIKNMDGEKERLRQYANYQKAITKIDPEKQQPDFDFEPLLQALIQASPQNVTEELKTNETFNPNYTSNLRAELEKLRYHFAPSVIEGGMHFNYANLQKAFDLYNEKFDALKEASNGNWDKRDLFCRQVIGFIQRVLPACDRQAFAQGIYYIVEDKEKLKRTFDFRFGGGSFPITASDRSRSGLGYEYDGVSGMPRRALVAGAALSNFMSSKSIKLAKLMQPHKQEQSRCVTF